MREILIVGLDHDENRNAEELVERVDGPVSAVYHETPEKQSNFWGLLWLLVAPAQSVQLLLNTVTEPRFRTQCQKAASELAEEADLEGVKPIDQSYEDRIRSRPKQMLIGEWVFLLLVPAGLIIDSLSALFSALALLVFLLIGKFNEEKELSNRDTAMVERLLSESPEKEGIEVVVVGEKHTRGIGGRLQKKGHSVQALWLGTILRN